MHKHSFFPKSRLVNIKHCDYKCTLTVRHIKGVTKKEMSQCILICFHYRGVAKLSIKKKKKKRWHSREGAQFKGRHRSRNELAICKGTREDGVK